MISNLSTAGSYLRSFFKKAGPAGRNPSAGLASGGRTRRIAQPPVGNFRFDTPRAIFTTALIAEDLATTFYYNGLIGKAIQDPSLAGPGGSVTKVAAAGNAGNVSHLQAALAEEIAHANLLRALLGRTSPSADPIQSFYLPSGSFDTAPAFLKLLDTLENAFIGAYLIGVESFAVMNALLNGAPVAEYSFHGEAHHSAQVQYYGELCGTILSMEVEHRLLGREISNSNPANSVCYEQGDGLEAVFTSPGSAVAALTPFLAPGPGLTAYSFATAIQNQVSVSPPAPAGQRPHSRAGA